MARGSVSRAGSEIALRGRVFNVTQDRFLLGDGKLIQRQIVRHPGAVVILAETANKKILLVRQYRYPIDRYFLELPAGTLEEGEEPLDCAKRELSEETGYQAETWRSIGVLYPAPGFCDERQELFFCRGLTPRALPCDEGEEIEVVEMPAGEVEAAIKAGTICDAKSISLFYRAKLEGLL